MADMDNPIFKNTQFRSKIMSGLLELCLCVSCLTNGRSYKQDPMLSIISYAHINSIEYNCGIYHLLEVVPTAPKIMSEKNAPLHVFGSCSSMLRKSTSVRVSSCRLPHTPIMPKVNR